MSYKFWIYKMPAIGASLFLLFNIVAMYFFGKPPYQLMDNYLSGLGQMYIAYSRFGTDYPNHLSMIIWGIGMSLGGATISLFYNNLPAAFHKEINLGSLPIYARYIGIVAGIFFMFVGLTPVDQVFDLHVFFANNAFRILLLLSIIHTVIIFRSDMMPNRYAIGYMLFCFLLAGYVWLISFGPSDTGVGKEIIDRSEWDSLIHAIHVLSQKVIAVTFIGTVVHQSFGMKRAYEN